MEGKTVGFGLKVRSKRWIGGGFYLQEDENQACLFKTHPMYNALPHWRISTSTLR